MPLSVIFMDAGQGDCTLIVYPDGSLTLVDCGCKKNKNIISGQVSAVFTRLMENAKRLKALVLTHPDGDHYNMVDSLIVKRGVEVATVYYGGSASDYSGLTSWLTKHPCAVGFKQGYGSVDVVSGLSYDGKGKNPNVEVRILAANAGDPNLKSDANPNSIVLLVSFLGINIFLMGDSTSLTEEFIKDSLGTQLAPLMKGRPSVLKAGHHGSPTSSTEAWLERVLPQVVFISSDTRTFGGVSIPRSSVIDRIFALDTLYDFGKKYGHYYVQYNDQTKSHQEVPTSRAMYTTLHLLKFKNETEFTAYGTSWYYSIDDKGQPGVQPACDWENINKAY